MAVHVEKHGKRIRLTGWAGPLTSARAKRVVGASANWDKTVTPNKFKWWTYPLDFTTCQQLRKEFGDDLTIGPELTAWAREEKKVRAAVLEIVKSHKFDLPSVAAEAPRLAAAMEARPYQQVGSAFLNAVKRGLTADEPGLGKTLQIMGAAIEAGLTGPILVLAPTAAVQVTWPNELRKWLPEDSVHVAVGGRAKRENAIMEFNWAVNDKPDKRHWLICNFEMARGHTGRPKVTKLCPEPGPFQWTHTDKDSKEVTKGFWHHPYADLFLTEWSMIVADESQKALITRTPEKTDQTQVRAGLGMLRIREGGMRVAASGTPFRGRKENLWGTLNWLRPDVYTSYWNWVKKYFDTFDDGHSLIIGELLPHMEEQFYAELDAVMIRRKKSEVVKELPPKQYMGAPLYEDMEGSLHGIWLDMDAKQEKAYHEIVQDAEAKLDSGNLLATGVLAEMTRLKQFSNCYGDLVETVRPDGETDFRFKPTLPSNKFDWLVEWLDERGHFDADPAGKVVIASQFTQIINLFHNELHKIGARLHVLTGETSAKVRKAAVDEFQGEGGPSIFFLNTDAGGVSLTLDMADDLIFLDEKWVPDDQTQVEDRIHRVSRMHQVRIWYVRSRGTIEETIGSLNEERDAMQLMLLDGRRGVDFAKRLIRGNKA